MLLSLEIPLRHLREFAPLVDFHFGLAHILLKKVDSPELELYHELYQGCLLDNSMYELGYPLPVDVLVSLAEKVQPMSVIAPDWLDDLSKTLEGMLSLVEARPKNASWLIGGVVQGKNLRERLKCYNIYLENDISPICFPFRSPRDQTIGALIRECKLREGQWYHLIGLRDLQELTWQFPGIWSVDTIKPFKGFALNEVSSIRGHGAVDLFGELSWTHRRLALWNIAYMRKLMRINESVELRHHIFQRRHNGTRR